MCIRDSRSLATIDESVKSSKVQLERLEHLMAEGRAFELVHLVVDNEPDVYKRQGVHDFRYFNGYLGILVKGDLPCIVPLCLQLIC